MTSHCRMTFTAAEPDLRRASIRRLAVRSAIAGWRAGREVATRPSETWAMDFVHDQLATGTKLRVLTVVDTFSRVSPAIVPRLTFRGANVVDVLERVCREMGFPATIRVDQGIEFVSRDLAL